MNREELINKWLDNELNPQELEAFKMLEDSADLVKLSNAVKYFKPKDLDKDLKLEQLNSTLKSRTKKTNNWFKPVLKIAAILAIFFSIFYYTTNSDTNIQTYIAQKETIILPDDSEVILNAMSTLIYNENKWDNNRELDLDGEAYFKVAKGKTFTVITNIGSVSVLGTQFNIKNRENIFEVICYEGSVQVNSKNHVQVLKPGDRFLILNNLLIEGLTVNNTNPFWINNESSFKSMPFTQVLAEFERQYNVTFNINNIDTNQLFTGSFAHNNMEVALKAITLPLNLTYSKNNNKISLKRE